MAISCPSSSGPQMRASEKLLRASRTGNTRLRQCARSTVGQIPKKCKETSNLMWLSMIWFISVLIVCWHLFCTILNLRIKCVTETKDVSGFFYKNLNWSFSTWLRHLTLRFLYILGFSGPQCGIEFCNFKKIERSLHIHGFCLFC